MLATKYASYYGIAPQQDNETDAAFRDRVSGALRDMGHIIEAHEAFRDERYEQSGHVMTGVFGALAQALQGVDYHRTGASQVGDDIAAGTIIESRKPKMTPEEALFMVTLFGKEGAR